MTTLRQGECDTGYVVVERSFLLLSSGTIYRSEGPFIGVAVGRSSGDDGYRPFGAGSYTMTRTADDWQIDHEIEPGRSASTALSLPVLDGHDCAASTAGAPRLL